VFCAMCFGEHFLSVVGDIQVLRKKSKGRDYLKNLEIDGTLELFPTELYRCRDDHVTHTPPSTVKSITYFSINEHHITKRFKSRLWILIIYYMSYLGGIRNSYQSILEGKRPA
jgi:hypothetical protein